MVSKTIIHEMTPNVSIPHVIGIWCYPAFAQRRSCLLYAQTPRLRFHPGIRPRNKRPQLRACGPSDPASCRFEEALQKRITTDTLKQQARLPIGGNLMEKLLSVASYPLPNVMGYIVHCNLVLLNVILNGYGQR